MATISLDDLQRSLRTRELDRRNKPDRRKSSVDMRLRVGLWYQYHRATRAGEFDALPRNAYMRSKVHESLLPEMHKYHFVQRAGGASVSSATALGNALDFLWSNTQLGCNVAGEPLAVYTVNALTEYLVQTYTVTMVDRRKVERRSTAVAS